MRETQAHPGLTPAQPAQLGQTPSLLATPLLPVRNQFFTKQSKGLEKDLGERWWLGSTVIGQKYRGETCPPHSALPTHTVGIVRSPPAEKAAEPQTTVLDANSSFGVVSLLQKVSGWADRARRESKRGRQAGSWSPTATIWRCVLRPLGHTIPSPHHNTASSGKVPSVSRQFCLDDPFPYLKSKPQNQAPPAKQTSDTNRSTLFPSEPPGRRARPELPLAYAYSS